MTFDVFVERGAAVVFAPVEYRPSTFSTRLLWCFWVVPAWCLMMATCLVLLCILFPIVVAGWLWYGDAGFSPKDTPTCPHHKTT